MSKKLENKVAIVTAASRGIGLEITHKLVEEGATVYMAVRDSEKNRKLTEELNAENKSFMMHLTILHIRKPLKTLLQMPVGWIF